MSHSIAVIGFPFAGGQPRSGVEHGPTVLRNAGLSSGLSSLGFKVDDLGDVQCNGSPNTSAPHNCARNSVTVGAATLALHNMTRSAIETHDNVVILGGDHSMAIGTVSAVLAADPETCIVWVDAHTDINTPGVSPSGNIHGMPNAFLAHLASAEGLEWLQQHKALDLGRIAFIGVRDVDEGERELCKQHRIACFTASDIERMGIVSVVQQALQRIDPDSQRRIHLSFDIDGVDPILAPSTGTPVPGGITFREARVMCEMLYETRRVRSMDMVEVNPLLEPDGASATASAAVEFILSTFGRKLL